MCFPVYPWQLQHYQQLSVYPIFHFYVMMQEAFKRLKAAGAFPPEVTDVTSVGDFEAQARAQQMTPLSAFMQQTRKFRVKKSNSPRSDSIRPRESAAGFQAV